MFFCWSKWCLNNIPICLKALSRNFMIPDTQKLDSDKNISLWLIFHSGSFSFHSGLKGIMYQCDFVFLIFFSLFILPGYFIREKEKSSVKKKFIMLLFLLSLILSFRLIFNIIFHCYFLILFLTLFLICCWLSSFLFLEIINRENKLSQKNEKTKSNWVF